MTQPLSRGLLVAALATALWGCASTPPPAAQRPSESSIAAHVAAATRAAGSDLGEVLTLCKPVPTARPVQDEAADRGLRALIARPAPPPGRAFDNLYFVGGDWASAWAVDTPEGIILIDALNNQVEATALIEGGMRKLGLDPARIRYIVVTHGHGDHYGGAPYLAQKYGARVVMSDIDWTMMETRLEFATPIWGAPPKRDISVKDGDKLTLGGTTLTLYVTPGHTWGTLSPVFDVSSQGRKHRVLLWGGTGFNFGADIPRMEAYGNSTQRMAKVVRPTVLVVGPSMKVPDFAAFLQQVKAEAGRRTYATPGAGSSGHFASEQFTRLTGTRMNHIPYKGAAQAVTDLVGGQVDSSFATLGSVLPQVQAGKLTALAVAAPQRSPLLPQVPTFDEAGVKGYRADAWYGLLAPAGTPPAALAVLQKTAQDFVRQGATQEKLRGLGMESQHVCGADFGAQLEREVKAYGQLARELDLKPE